MNHWDELGRAKSGFNLHSDSLILGFFRAIWEGLEDVWAFTFGRLSLLRRKPSANGYSDAVFYGTAIRLSAVVAMADGRVDVREFEQLKAALGGVDHIISNAKSLFDEQIKRPSSLLVILSEFLADFGRSSPAAEAMLVALCAVANADGHAAHEEVRRIRMIGEMLGIYPSAINRILAAADIDIHAHRQSKGGFGQEQSGFRAEPESSGTSKHLAVLGLSAGATQAEIKSAYRKLAKRYHPDKLAGQGLPAKEVARAEAMMVKINNAYEALKA